MQTGILRGMSVLAGLLWLASCSSSPKSRDYPGYMTRPYTIRGHRYHPMNVEQALTYEQTGIASHYNECALWGLVSGKTAIGENVRPWHLHAAHPTLPLPCEVLVQSLRTGKTVKVRVNDRGPFIKNRIIDLSEEAAERLDMKHHGLDKVRITVLSVGDGKWKKKRPLAPLRPDSLLQHIPCGLKMHLGHLGQHFFPMQGHQLARSFHHLAGSSQRQLHAGSLSRRIHPIHKTFARQNRCRSHSDIALRPDTLFQPDRHLLAASALFRTNGLANWSLNAMGQSGTLAASPSITVACPQARKRFKFPNAG